MTAPGVILINPKWSRNVGSAIRACSCFDVGNLAWTGTRLDIGQFTRLPREERMKGYRDVEWVRSDKPLELFKGEITPVCVEVMEESEPLTTFQHPENAVYIFGPEDGGVPQVYRKLCHRFVHIQARHCLNLAGALYVVLNDRRQKRQLAGLEPLLLLGNMLQEQRGEVTPEVMESLGWNGR